MFHFKCQYIDGEEGAKIGTLISIETVPEISEGILASFLVGIIIDAESKVLKQAYLSNITILDYE